MEAPREHDLALLAYLIGEGMPQVEAVRKLR